jgi:hypothetical protein
MEGSPENVSSLGSGNSKLSARQFVSPVSNGEKKLSSVGFGTSVPSVLPTRPASERKKSSID